MRFSRVFNIIKAGQSWFPGTSQLTRSLSVSVSSTNPQTKLVSTLKNWNGELDITQSLKKYKRSFNEPFSFREVNTSYATSRIVMALQHWYNLPQDKLNQVDDVMQHFQDLIIFYDDIIDCAEIRRGEPTPNVTFGTEHATNCAIYNIFRSQNQAFELTKHDPEVVKAWTEYFHYLYRSEGYDKVWANSDYCPTLEEYGLNIVYRVGWYTYLCAKVMEHFSDFKPDIRRFSEIFGVYYQFCDDYENYFMPESFFEGKEKFADDLTEGKFSLPTIHAIRIIGNEEIAETIRKRPADIESKRLFARKMKEIGTKDFCRGVLVKMEQDIFEEADKIGPNPVMRQIMERIKDWE